MRDKIIDLYKTLLAVGWLVADDDGKVSVELGDDKTPATIGGKRLIVPTVEQMKDTNWDDRIGFHPLREAFNMGVSDVVSCLRDQYVQRLNTSISYFMKELIDISHDQAGQKKLSPEQATILDTLSKCDDRTVRDFADLMKKTKARNTADQFIGIHIRRGGKVKGDVYGRAGIVVFPIYDQLKKTKEPINGVKFSVKDREMLIKLHEFIFPQLTEDPEFFSVGVNSRTAPFLEALVRSTYKVVSAVVRAAKPYMDIVDLPTVLTFPEDLGAWDDVFDSKDMAERLARSIPALNTHDNGNDEAERKSSSESKSRESDRPKREEREERSRDPEPERREEPKSEASAGKSNMVRGAGGRMIMGAASALSSTTRTAIMGKSRDEEPRSKPGSQFANERQIRELEERERKVREAQQAIDRARREDERREREEDERDRRRSDREYDDRRSRDDRDRERSRRDERDREYDDRDRRRRDDRDDDCDRRGRTGDPFEDNPVLRRNLRDEEDSRSRRDRDSRDSRRRDSRYDRHDRDRRGRDDRDDRDDRDRGYDDRRRSAFRR